MQIRWKLDGQPSRSQDAIWIHRCRRRLRSYRTARHIRSQNPFLRRCDLERIGSWLDGNDWIDWIDCYDGTAVGSEQDRSGWALRRSRRVIFVAITFWNEEETLVMRVALLTVLCFISARSLGRERLVVAQRIPLLFSTMFFSQRTRANRGGLRTETTYPSEIEPYHRPPGINTESNFASIFTTALRFHSNSAHQPHSSTDPRCHSLPAARRC